MSICNNRILLQMLVPHSPVRSSLRLYSRWMHRSPAKVLLPFGAGTKGNLKKEKVIDLDPALLKKGEINKEIIHPQSSNEIIETSTVSSEKAEQIKNQKEEKLKRHKFYLSQQKVFDDNGDIIYERLKDNDAKVSSLLVKLKSKKDRLRSGQVFVEGWRLIVDGLEAKCSLNYVLFSRTADLDKLRPFLPKTGIKFYKIPYKELQLWSDVETSPGIIGVFQMPTVQNVNPEYKPLPIQLICDNIRVPGNLGAILRVAVGAGCDKILLTKGCVDVWDSKVIRSAAGAHFRLPIHHSMKWSEIESNLHHNTSVFIADSNSYVENASNQSDITKLNDMPVIPYYSVDFSSLKHTTLILGGETEGISDESYALAASKSGLRLNIPLQKGVDSLNTGMAIAVIAFEVRKQLIQALRKQKMENLMLQAT